MRVDLRIFCTIVLLVGVVKARQPNFGRMNHALEAWGHARLPEHNIGAEWFVNLVDHFDPLNTATWKQRYFVNDTWYKPGGPVFLMLGGEGAIDQRYVDGHFVLNDWAMNHQAKVIALEHRFYGASNPTADLSTENLRFHNSQQALADAARFVEDQKKTGDDKGRWVVFGGSYPGCLSAWFRLKYPNLVVGSIASSAPVYATEDFPQYQEVVADSIGKETADRVRQAFEQIDSMTQTQEGRDQLKQLFDLCMDVPVDDERNLDMFIQALIDPIDGIVQYNAEGPPGSPTIDTIQDLMASASDPLQAYVNLTRYFNPTGCFDWATYEEYIDFIRNTTLDPERPIDRQWTFQTCVEFGYFQTNEGSHQPFGKYIPLAYYEQICDDAFGQSYKLRPHIDWTNTFYGERKIDGTNIVFPNGSIDPWHALGILEDVGETLNAVFIKGTAHCQDMRAPTDNDIPALVEARQKIYSYLSTFLTEA